MVSLVLVAAGLLTTAAPVAAVRNLPWRFVQVTSVATGISYQETEGWALQCPAGYTPVSGGVIEISNPAADIERLLEYPNPAAGTFHIMVYNGWEGTNVTVAATCVWLEDVGDITTVWGEFARNGSGRAGGYTWCPEGMTVLSGGTDWNGTNTARQINFSTVVGDANGHGGGWYAAGYSPTSGDKLNVELRCVADGLVGGEYFEADDSPTQPSGTATAQCASGYRLLTGGAIPSGTLNPGVFQGRTEISGPLDYRRWKVHGYIDNVGGTLRAFGLCVPASTASVTFTQTPPSLSMDRTGSITFTATDTAGETLALSCFRDGNPVGCASGNPVNYFNLVDGIHFFTVNVKNQSGFNQSFQHIWTVDATAPLRTGNTPTPASLTGPMTITFSEPVTGVSASSITVHAETANVNIAGTVTRPTTSTATWKPNTRLVPGETYRVSFSSAIQDLAGNPLVPTFFTVRTATTIENTSTIALERFWDRDALAAASGGSYITSRLSGSVAKLTFTAAAGQTVSIYGIRMASGGYADIYLDGVKKATPSFYAATTGRARVYLSPALTAGSHTVEIRPTGAKPASSTDTWVSVDNVQVGATVKQETTLTQTFRQVSHASAYGGSYDQVVQRSPDTTPALYRLAFVGTGVKVYATKSSSSGSVRIYVDNVLKATVNLNAASTTYKALVYSTTFALGSHNLRIEAVGTATGNSSSVNLDRITID